MKNLYNEDYYERGVELGISGYSNFRWMPEMTIPVCYRMIEYLGINSTDTILDFGCAKGYVVKGFRLLFKEAYGYDISEYAISKADEDVKPYLLTGDVTHIEERFDWLIAKDVFEHIDYEYIDELLAKLSRLANKFFVVVPLADDKKYVVPSYELDKTRIIRESREWWENAFNENGYNILNSVYRVSNIKENYKKWERGNLFITLEKD
jgi:cyclopropane fatty-acyl-phospholipid synthase-like methyltransferase